MTKSKAPQYTLASSNPSTGGYAKKSSKSSKSRRGSSSSNHGGEDPDPTDGTGSLTYSATSSVQSGGSSSATGESTDSSFADIMRVLDLQPKQDSQELKELMRKEGVSSAGELRQKRLMAANSGVSVASSLNYSLDGEPHLEGSTLLQTIAGQPSREATIKGDSADILFAPAEPGAAKKKKRHKKGHNTTPKAKDHKRYDSSSPSPSEDTPTKSPPNSSSSCSTPPPVPKSFVEDVGSNVGGADDVWYAKWWVSCFPDAFKDLSPKR